MLVLAQGGVWKTTNAGSSWAPTSDNEYSLAIGALAIDKKNPLTLYAGTGEANFGGDSQYGLGIIKTVDGVGHGNQRELARTPSLMLQQVLKAFLTVVFLD